MLCPVDNSELLIDSVGGYPVHRCGQCFGVALKGNLLREVRAYLALKMHKQDGTADAGSCPVDSKAMMTLEYKSVSMCACPQCLGLWLPRDQLPRLLKIVGPPRQADLSDVVQNLSTTRSFASSGNLDGIGDILEMSAEIIDAIGNLAD